MEKRKAPHVLFDDIDHDIKTKVEFLRKQNDLLKEINQDYKLIGAKINLLASTSRIVDAAELESPEMGMASPLL
jgi:hypothetical protein